MPITRWLAGLLQQSRVLQAGVAVLAVGGSLDLIVHMLYIEGAAEYYAHLLTLAGMLLTIAGIIVPRHH